MKHLQSWLVCALIVACGCASEKDKADADGAAGTRGLDGIVTLPDGGDGDGDGDGDGAVDEGDPDGSAGDGGDDGAVADPDGGDSDAGDSGPSCDPAEEVCDEVDNDCDLRIDEDLDLGEACDGPDDDDCKQGTLECDGDGEVVCEESARDLSLEVCDEIDNDCDDEIDEGFADLGDACDGSDDDLCEDGSVECNDEGDGTTCVDDATERLDLCNDVDDDCDPASTEGSDDLRDTDPVCASSRTDLGALQGDLGVDVLTDSGIYEKWLLVRVGEANGAEHFLSATVTLVSPADTDYDLRVYCYSCGGDLAGSSLSTGSIDTVEVRREDNLAGDDSFDVLIEVEHYSSLVCADWELTIEGNSEVAVATCL